MSEYAIIIQSGNSKNKKPRLNYINNKIQVYEYALLHVSVEIYDRFLTVEYDNSLSLLLNKISSITNNEISDSIKEELLNGEEVWITNNVNIGTGNIFQIFHIQDLETESIKKMLIRIIDVIPSALEGNNIDEYEAYDLNNFDSILPDFFVIFCEKIDNIN